MNVRGRYLVGLVVFGLTLPAFAVRSWTHAYADALGQGIAAWLTAVVPAAPAPPDPAGLDEFDAPEPPFASTSGARATPLEGKRPAPRARPVPRQGIRVSAAQVLALASRRAMPNAVFVKATSQRPAGLLLSGVSALGVGLQDGDVLTEAAGQRASSVAAVVGIVLAARARQASEISGRFYRAGVPFLLTVEQPYPKVPVPG